MNVFYINFMKILLIYEIYGIITSVMSDIMSKIRIRHCLKKENEKIGNSCLGIFRDNKIIYNDNNITTTLDINKLILTRKNNEYEINLYLLEEKANITINEGKMNLELKLLNKEINENNIKIEYILNDEKIIYELEYEVI